MRSARRAPAPARGVLTMAYGPPAYLRMAKGLARSIRLHSPGTSIAIVTDRREASLRSCFDIVIPYDARYGPGLSQKLHLDRYSPFDETLFVDADFLLFRPVEVFWQHFRDAEGLGVVGYHLAPGEGHYAVDDLPAYMAKLGLARMVMTNTGVMYFDRTPVARAAFEKAREIASGATNLGLRAHPAGFFNDEPIYGSVVELLGLPVAPPALHPEAIDDPTPIFTLGCFGTSGMSHIDVRSGASRHVYEGRSVEPAAIHFNVKSQDSKVYDRELRRLELGRALGSTRAPDLVTDLRWAAASLLRALRPAARNLRRLLSHVDGLPLSRYIRTQHPTAAPLVAEVARRAREPFTFVQVGANDGQTGDPLHDTVTRTKVRGLLVEPVPELFERLGATYAGTPGLSLVQAAVGDEEGTRQLHWVPQRPGDPFWVEQLGSFSRDVVLSHEPQVPGLADRIQTLTVPSRTLASLVAEHGLDRIDLLHTDTEGSDLEILRTIDFDAEWAPRCILYEQKHLGPEKAAAIQLLHREGYRVLGLGPDAFAYRGARGRLRARVRRSVRGRRPVSAPRASTAPASHEPPRR